MSKQMKLLKVLQHRPLSVQQMARFLDTSEKNVTMILSRLRKKPGRRIFISGWELSKITKRRYALYSAGNQPDAEIPDSMKTDFDALVRTHTAFDDILFRVKHNTNRPSIRCVCQQKKPGRKRQ